MIRGSLSVALAAGAFALAGSAAEAQVNHGVAHPLPFNNPLTQGNLYTNDPGLRFNNPLTQANLYANDPGLRFNNPLIPSGLRNGVPTGTTAGTTAPTTAGFNGLYLPGVAAVSGGGYYGFGGGLSGWSYPGNGYGNGFGYGGYGYGNGAGGFANPMMMGMGQGGMNGGFNGGNPNPLIPNNFNPNGNGFAGGAKENPDASAVLNGAAPTSPRAKGSKSSKAKAKSKRRSSRKSS
jgi:hypothetical protein